MVVLLLAAFVAACAPQPDEIEDEPLLVRVLFPLHGLGDRSFADAAYEGIVRAGLEYNLVVTHGTPDDMEEAAMILHEWLAEPATRDELIISVGVKYSDLIAAVDCPLAPRMMLHLDERLPEACDNVRSVSFGTFAPSFLAGVASLSVAKRPFAAAIGGMDVETVNLFLRGFEAGVVYAGGTMRGISYLSEDVDGFANPELAKETAQFLYQESDVVFPVAGGSNPGVFEAAKEQEGRFSLGVDSDQSWMGVGVIVGSVTKHLDKAIIQAVADVTQRNFVGGPMEMGLTQGGTALVINDLFEQEVRNSVEMAREAALAAEAMDREQHP